LQRSRSCSIRSGEAETAPRARARCGGAEQRLAEFRAAIERRLNEQTRWLLGAWGILFAAVIDLWFR
jgi:hypothetical protein